VAHYDDAVAPVRKEQREQRDDIRFSPVKVIFDRNGQRSSVPALRAGKNDDGSLSCTPLFQEPADALDLPIK